MAYPQTNVEPKAAPQYLTRNAPATGGSSAPANPVTPPQNAEEVAALANDLRSAFADLQTRMNDRLAAVEGRGATIDQVRAELEPHARAIADMQDALTRANRPQNPRTDMNIESDQRERAALSLWLRRGDHSALVALNAWHPEMAEHMTADRMAERAAASAQSNPLGGYVVLPDLDRNIDRISAVYAQFAQYARTVVIGVQEYQRMLRKNGAQLVWTEDENAADPDTDAGEWILIRIPAHEGRMIPLYPRNLLNDSFWDLNAEIALDLGEATAVGTNQAYVTGNGVGKPRGFLSYPTAEQVNAKVEPALGTVGFVKTGSAAGFAATPGQETTVFVNVIARLKPQYLANARWMMDRVSLSQVMLFRDAQDRPLWQPSIQAGVPSALYAFPIAIMDEMPTGGANVFPVAFGDFRSAYTIVRRAGMEILQNPYRTTGWVRFETFVRFGGGLNKSEALKLIKWAA